jgi:hypothetical protein
MYAADANRQARLKLKQLGCTQFTLRPRIQEQGNAYALIRSNATRPSLILGAEIFYLTNAFYRGLIGRVTVFDRAVGEDEIRILYFKTRLEKLCVYGHVAESNASVTFLVSLEFKIANAMNVMFLSLQYQAVNCN